MKILVLDESGSILPKGVFSNLVRKDIDSGILYSVYIPINRGSDCKVITWTYVGPRLKHLHTKISYTAMAVAIENLPKHIQLAIELHK